MNGKIEQSLINELTRASNAGQPVSIKHKDQTVAVVLPVADYQQLQIEQEQKLESLKTELNGVLTLIRSRLKYQSLEKLEAQLLAHQQKIRQK